MGDPSRFASLLLQLWAIFGNLVVLIAIVIVVGECCGGILWYEI